MFVIILSLLGIVILYSFKRPMNFVKWRLAEITPLQRVGVLATALINDVVTGFCSVLMCTGYTHLWKCDRDTTALK